MQFILVAHMWRVFLKIRETAQKDRHNTNYISKLQAIVGDETSMKHHETR